VSSLLSLIAAFAFVCKWSKNALLLYEPFLSVKVRLFKSLLSTKEASVLCKVKAAVLLVALSINKVTF